MFPIFHDRETRCVNPSRDQLDRLGKLPSVDFADAVDRVLRERRDYMRSAQAFSLDLLNHRQPNGGRYSSQEARVSPLDREFHRRWGMNRVARMDLIAVELQCRKALEQSMPVNHVHLR